MPREYTEFSNAPADGNPIWQKWSAPVQEFIATPRTWAELRQWAHKRMQLARLRQCLAWLANRGLAWSDYFDGEIRWSSSPRPLKVPHLPDPDEVDAAK